MGGGHSLHGKDYLELAALAGLGATGAGAAGIGPMAGLFATGAPAEAGTAASLAPAVGMATTAPGAAAMFGPEAGSLGAGLLGGGATPPLSSIVSDAVAAPSLPAGPFAAIGDAARGMSSSPGLSRFALLAGNTMMRQSQQQQQAPMGPPMRGGYGQAPQPFTLYPQAAAGSDDEMKKLLALLAQSRGTA